MILLPIIIVIYSICNRNNITDGDLLLLYLMSMNFIIPLNKILMSIDEILYKKKYFNKIIEFCSLKEKEKENINYQI